MLVSPQGGGLVENWRVPPLGRLNARQPARPLQESPGALGGVNAPLQGSQSWLAGWKIQG